MKLIDVVDNINQMDENSVIFIAENDLVNEDTNATIIPDSLLPGNGRAPEGLKYLLEVNLVKELIDVWRNWRSGKEPTRKEKYLAFVYFIEHDAYLPPEDN